MKSVKELFIAGETPSKVFRALLKSGECKNIKDIVTLMISEYPELPPSILNTITRWNRERNPNTESQGLNDKKIDEIIMGLYGKELKKEPGKLGL